MKYQDISFHSLRSIITFSICTVLLGCAVKGSGPVFSFEKPTNDIAIIYHYRIPHFRGSAAQYDVLSNDVPMTTIGNGGYFKQIVKPGHIVYKTKYQVHGSTFLLPIDIANEIDNARASFDKAYSLDAEAGKVYFLRWGVGEIPKIEPIPENEALNEMKGLKSFLPAPSIIHAENTDGVKAQ